mgnify:CR=1 FL=1
MTLPSASNAISMSDIRTEFGTSGQLSLSDLYQASGTGATNMLVRNVDSNDDIPDSGEISFGDFHGITGNSANAYELSSLLSEDSARQYAFSRTSFAAGMRTASGASDEDTQSHNYRYSTSVSGSNTFSSSFPNGIWGAATGSTHIAMNYNQGSTSSIVGWPAITIGGSGVSETNASNCNLIYNYYSNNKVNNIVRWGYFKSNSNLNGLSVGVTYSKTSTNSENRQMFFALPGKWSDVLHNNTSGNSFDIDGDTALTGTTSFTAQKGDIVFTISSMWYDDYVSHGTTVSNSTSCLYSRTRWYQNTNVRIFVIDTAGSCTINANSRATSYIVFRLD